MGKRLICQRRGRGSPLYRSRSHRYKCQIKYPRINPGEILRAQVIDIDHDPLRSGPIAKIRFQDGTQSYMIAVQGMGVGEILEFGEGAEIKPGNVLPLAKIPEGTTICNVELRPGDGGKLARAPGSYAILSSQGAKVEIKLPSRAVKALDPSCLATVGMVAGGGRKEKPFLKAGKKFHCLRSKARKWPRVRGVAMNPVDHPFGGGKHQHEGKPKTVSRGAPPGRKVGSIAARRTGRRKK